MRQLHPFAHILRILSGLVLSLVALPGLLGNASQTVAPVTTEQSVEDFLKSIRDLPTTFADYLKRAQQGDVDAQIMVGMSYDTGVGVPRDKQQAAKWFRRAADQGDLYGQMFLAHKYDVGEGVSMNKQEAIKWYRLAAEQGDAEARKILGQAYDDGDGVQKNKQEAIKWYRLAAEQGDSDAQISVGVLYWHGEGVPQDYVNAYFWFNVAATYAEKIDDRANDIRMYREDDTSNEKAQHVRKVQKQASQYRQRIAVNMTAQQIAHAQELSSQWRPKKEMPASTNRPLQTAKPGKILEAPAGVSGTGFYVSQAGYVLTNAHVVERCARIRLRDPDGTMRDVSVTGRDEHNDLALLKSLTAAPRVASFTGKPLRLGQPIIVYGFPLSGLLTSTGNLTTGGVAGLAGPGDDARLMQISAPIQPGNSGSPVLDIAGNVLGVVVSKLDAIAVANATEDIPQNINFAIKANLAMNFLESLGVEFAESTDGNTLLPEAIAARAIQFTVRVECVR